VAGWRKEFNGLQILLTTWSLRGVAVTIIQPICQIIDPPITKNWMMTNM
jgi:hypothetical protein